MAKIIINLSKTFLIRPFLQQKHIQIRLIGSTESKIKKENNVNELVYVKSDKLYKISKTTILKTLQEILKINKVLATQIITNHEQLCKVSSTFLIDNYEICKIYGVTTESVINCPYLLAQKDLLEKMQILSELPDDINKMVGLLKMNFKELSNTVEQFKNGGNRVIYFSKLLNASPLEICEQMEKKPFLINLDLEKTSELVELLREHGISDREILNDLWALKYKKSTMEKRIQFAKENNLEKVKTWMIRAQPNILLNYIKIRSDNKLILGNNSLSEYLSQRLECPIEQSNYIITKLPALKRKSMKKMDEIIDYLYEQGFKPIQICVTPKILLHSVETMKKRILELQQQGVYVDNLNLLTKTQKQYQDYYSKLVKNNKKKIKGIE